MTGWAWGWGFSERPDESLHTLLAGRESILIDQLLVDAEGISTSGQLLFDEIAKRGREALLLSDCASSCWDSAVTLLAGFGGAACSGPCRSVIGIAGIRTVLAPTYQKGVRRSPPLSNKRSPFPDEHQ